MSIPSSRPIATEREKGLCNIGFSVEDNGMGIAGDKQEAIFDPFMQADYSTTKKFGGTGLGLAISDNIIRMMDGRLSLQSEPGKGSRFSFDLRFRVSDRAYETVQRERFDLNIALYGSPVNGPSQESVIMKYLQYLGCKVFFFDRTSISAENGKIDAVLISVPPIDAELIEIIKRKTDAPVMAIAKEYDMEILSAEFDHVVYQPVHLSKLMTVLSELSKAAVPFPGNHSVGCAAENTFHARVLIAEDVPTNQKLIEVILRALGMEVDIAENGLEAVEKFTKGNYDIIFMDVHMPLCDGNEATRMIRDYERLKLQAPTKIIALTADAMKGTREKLLASGMDDYITKPIDRKVLKKLLEKYLNKKTI